MQKPILFGAPNSYRQFSLEYTHGRRDGAPFEEAPRHYLIAKRAFDVFASSVGIVILMPLFALTYLTIFITSSGNPIFIQSRWGQHGKLIKVFKFRTLKADQCDQRGIVQVEPNDGRVTEIGRFLRRTNIDELPQLINVLIGDISLVGPRCHVPNMLAGGVLYEDLVPNYRQRLTVKPGLTGLAQLRGLRGPTTNKQLARDRISADFEYIQKRSFWLDVRIVFQTVVKELRQASGS